MGFYTTNGLNWMPSCSVVIRAYNEAAQIGRLLEGLSRQTVRDLEVILVDSGSTDSTAEQAVTAGAKDSAILGHLSGLPPQPGMELEFTADLLLPAWHGNSCPAHAQGSRPDPIQGIKI